MIVVIDCNIWITLAINAQLDFIADLFDNDIVIASCDDLKTEISSVLHRPRFKKYIDDSGIQKVIELHDLVTTYFRLGEIPSITADPKDDYLFALAAESGAEYLVTGDKLLLNVGVHNATQLITLSSFRLVVKT